MKLKIVVLWLRFIRQPILIFLFLSFTLSCFNSVSFRFPFYLQFSSTLPFLFSYSLSPSTSVTVTLLAIFHLPSLSRCLFYSLSFIILHFFFVSLSLILHLLQFSSLVSISLPVSDITLSLSYFLSSFLYSFLPLSLSVHPFPLPLSLSLTLYPLQFSSLFLYLFMYLLYHIISFSLVSCPFLPLFLSLTFSFCSRLSFT